MHDVQVQIRCQRCGAQMELRDPGPDDPWPPQQFWECPECGRHFWTTYPPPKPAKPAGAATPAAKASPAAAATPAAKASPAAAATPAAKAASDAPPAVEKPVAEGPSEDAKTPK